MKRFKFANFAGSIALLTIAILTNIQDSIAQQSRAVEVINSPANPVPTKNVENPARHSYQIGFELFGQNSPTVPAGKIFVIEHISGSMRIGSPFNAPAPCRILQLALAAGGTQPIDVIPVHMGSATGINGDVNFVTISQPVRAYASPNSQFGGANMVLSQHCNPFPLMFSNIVLTGHLVDAP